MKILMYTRIEGNTGGDQTLLFMIAGTLIENVPEGSQIHLFISHDPISTNRAEFIRDKWIEMAEEKSCSGHVDLKMTAPGVALLTKCFPNSPKLKKFVVGTGGKKNPPLDIFVVAGWSHLQNARAAVYLKEMIKVPSAAKILLCTPPGGYIDFNGFKSTMREIGYHNLFCFQPGLHEMAGFPLPNVLSRDIIMSEQVREHWERHILENFEAGSGVDIGMRFNRADKDNLIVIYCSKDGPGQKGIEFIDEIRAERAANLNDYTVLLVGAEEGSSAHREWHELLSGDDEVPALNSCVLPRTERSEILMRGLHDAEYSMATGSFSILEAKSVGIHHCRYLSPPHLTDFGRILDGAEQVQVEGAFERGNITLVELGRLCQPDFAPQYLSHETARAVPNEEAIIPDNPGMGGRRS